MSQGSIPNTIIKRSLDDNLVFFQRIFVSSSCFVDRSACQPRSFRACAWFGGFRRLSSWEVPCISTPYVDHWKAFYLFRSMSQAKRAVKQREVIGALTFQLLTLKTPAQQVKKDKEDKLLSCPHRHTNRWGSNKQWHMVRCSDRGNIFLQTVAKWFFLLYKSMF